MLQIPLSVGVFNALKYACEELILICILQKAVRNICGLWIRKTLKKRNYVFGGTPLLDDLALQPSLGRRGRSRICILLCVIFMVHGSALFLELGTDSVEVTQFSGMGTVVSRTSLTDHLSYKDHVSISEMQLRGLKSVAGCVERLEDKSIFRAAEINGSRCSEEYSLVTVHAYAGMPSDCELIGNGNCRLTGMRMEILEEENIFQSELPVHFIARNISAVLAHVHAYYGKGIAGSSISVHDDDEEDLGIRKFICVNSIVGISFEDRAICITERIEYSDGRGLFLKVYESTFEESTSFQVGKWYQSDAYGAAIFNSVPDGKWMVRPDAVILAAEEISFGNTIDTPADLKQLTELISISSVGDFGDSHLTRNTRLIESTVQPVIRLDAIIVYSLFILVVALTALVARFYGKDEYCRLNDPMTYIAIVCRGNSCIDLDRGLSNI